MIQIKKIHLTCKDKDNINTIWNKCLNKYREMYPDYDIIIYDNNDIYKLIEIHFPEYVNKIKQIKIGAILADIFRYLILYLEGGIYSDLDCIPIKRFDELFNENYKYFHGDKKRDDHFYIYKNSQIINNKWDFTHNVCNNSKIINNTSNPIVMKCLGHTIDDPSIILCYEFHSDWLNPSLYKGDQNGSNGNIYKDAVKKYNFQICQWFMISKPKQDIFLKMFKFCMKNIDILINIDKNSKDYEHIIINLTGPSAFTHMVMNNLSNKIKILPSDFFCTGSWDSTVPLTKNSYVKHLFAGSWRSNKWYMSQMDRIICSSFYSQLP